MSNFIEKSTREFYEKHIRPLEQKINKLEQEKTELMTNKLEITAVENETYTLDFIIKFFETKHCDYFEFSKPESRTVKERYEEPKIIPIEKGRVVYTVKSSNVWGDEDVVDTEYIISETYKQGGWEYSEWKRKYTLSRNEFRELIRENYKSVLNNFLIYLQSHIVNSVKNVTYHQFITDFELDLKFNKKGD